ncbi:MAG: sugar ABC transporter ATP-binding protein [Bacillota bacterium]
MGNNVILKMEGVTKSFGATKALKGVDLDICVGEVHAIVGSNGAGKSTLMKTLMGEHKPDQGKLYYEGKDVTGLSPLAMQELGIQIVHQVINIVPSLTILENILIYETPVKGGILDWKTGEKRVNEVLDYMDIHFNLKQSAGSLTVAEQQFVVIARALISNPKVLILDEPTSRISLEETEKLFSIINRLKANGVTTIYISHRMEEIYKICNKISIFRDGQRVETRDTDDITEDELVQKMLGKKLDMFFPKVTVPIGEAMLEVKDLHYKDKVNGISFDVKKGEILALVGAVGAGKSETLGCIYGIMDKDSGSVTIDGAEMKKKYSAHKGIKSGIALVPEDRALHGMIGESTIKENTSSVSMQEVSKFGFLNNKKDAKKAQESNDKLLVHPNDIGYKMVSLSGGNQQKVVIGKWLLEPFKVYLLDEVAAGVDIGAKAEIYKILGELVGNGSSVVLSTGDIEEAIGLADRIIVLYKGEIIKELDPKTAEKSEILKYIMGGGHNEET